MDLDPRQNPVHPPLYLYQRIDPISCHYWNHWYSPPLCYQNILFSFCCGLFIRIVLPNLGFWCLRDHIHMNIGNGACSDSIFFLRRFRTCTRINGAVGGILLSGGTLVDRDVGNYGGAVTSSTAMALFWLSRVLHA